MTFFRASPNLFRNVLIDWMRGCLFYIIMFDHFNANIHIQDPSLNIPDRFPAFCGSWETRPSRSRHIDKHWELHDNHSSPQAKSRPKNMCFFLKGDQASQVKTLVALVTQGGTPNSPYLPTTADSYLPQSEKKTRLLTWVCWCFASAEFCLEKVFLLNHQSPNHTQPAAGFRSLAYSTVSFFQAVLLLVPNENERKSIGFF